jgi:two-component system chemotaxis response regulator CheB
MEDKPPLVLIGASAGGVSALIRIAQALPPLFPAPICVVQHIGNHPSLLPDLLRFRGANHAMHAEDGQRLTTGTIHVAPPDHHMLIEGDLLRLSHGPKENHVRPAIDPLFRTAALDHGPRLIGVVLTGQLDDGTAGLKAIKACGGTAVVQDPLTAEVPQMPSSALAHVDVDHIVPLAEIAPLLVRLVGAPAQRVKQGHTVPEHVQREAAINRGAATMENLSAIADPSTLTCPDCGGGLWELREQKPLRYRCHTGHAYSPLSLASAQQESAEHALWASIRALRERQLLLRRLASVATATGDQAQADAGEAEVQRLQRQIAALSAVATVPAPPLEDDATA